LSKKIATEFLDVSNVVMRWIGFGLAAGTLAIVDDAEVAQHADEHREIAHIAAALDDGQSRSSEPLRKLADLLAGDVPDVADGCDAYASCRADAPHVRAPARDRRQGHSRNLAVEPLGQGASAYRQVSADPVDRLAFDISPAGGDDDLRRRGQGRRHGIKHSSHDAGKPARLERFVSGEPAR
jgi:hypothetical protein